MDLAYRTPEDEITALRHELAAARAQLGTAAVEIAHLRAQLAALRRQQYGQSSPGPGLIAHVAVSKYCDGLPLFRQSVILAREGVEIDRVTLADWIGRAA